MGIYFDMTIIYRREDGSDDQLRGSASRAGPRVPHRVPSDPSARRVRKRASLNKYHGSFTSKNSDASVDLSLNQISCLVPTLLQNSFWFAWIPSLNAKSIEGPWYQFNTDPSGSDPSHATISKRSCNMVFFETRNCAYIVPSNTRTVPQVPAIFTIWSASSWKLIYYALRSP